MTSSKARVWVVAFLIGLSGFAIVAEGKVVYVAKTGSDANDGLSWSTAKVTVQAGLNAAAAKDQVWVAAGTYVERITLPAEVALYGGFAGGEWDLSERSWTANQTILDADEAGSVVTASKSGANGTTRIDGFTIRNGKTESGGGGVYCSARLTIANCIISGNVAGYGGGVYTSNMLDVSCTVISANAAAEGGGIYCGTYSWVGLRSCAIVGNGYDAIKALDASGIGMTNCTVVANSGSVISSYSYEPLNVIVTNTIVAFNTYGFWLDSNNTFTGRSNCVYGNVGFNYGANVPDPTGTNGNLSVDPQLAAVAYGNIHIQPTSPCVNAGDDSVLQTGTFDIDGQLRKRDVHVDIGADESNGTVWSSGPAVVVRVSPEGDDAHDGSSWTSAKRTVQAAANTATTFGGEVWVKAGEYDEEVLLKAFAHVYGGFSGTEAQRDERNWRAHPTTLRGSGSGPVVLVSQSGGQGVCTLDGFTVRNGGEAKPSDLDFKQGGVFCLGSSPTIAHNTISGNVAGGVNCRTYASPTITDNIITGNGGGGLSCDTYCSPSVANNTIVGNSGDGIACLNASPVIVNTIVAFNAGGIYINAVSAPVLRFNCVYGNASYNYSGVTDPTGTDGNISADPRLADYAHGNMHIQPDSPCVNSGDDGIVQPNELDMDGQARKQGEHVDIGADESDGTTWPTEPGVIIRVSLEGNDGNDGSSWPLAKRTVQAALDAASTTGGEVWVKEGTYNGTISLRELVYLFGGFSGSETQRNERDWRTHATVLDGQQSGSTVTAAGGGDRYAIDGFTIRNGNGTQLSATMRFGGGILCNSASPAIRNNTITGNALPTTGYGEGGGIALVDSQSAVVNNIVKGNTSSALGAGISCMRSSAVIAGNTITGNAVSGTVSGSGGGISCMSSAALIKDNVIIGNTAEATYSESACGGGVYCYNTDSPTLVDNVIIGNTAKHYGGGVYCAIGSPTITNITVVGNTAKYGGGGGICFRDASPVVANSVVAFNTNGGVHQVYDGTRTPVLYHNCVYGNKTYDFMGLTNPTGTDGNISADPLFALSPTPGLDGKWGTSDDELGNLRLRNGSPCIDAGDNSAVPAGIVTDIDNQARFADDPATADTGLGTPPIVDMGAYEYQASLAILSATSVKTHAAAGELPINILAPGAVEPRRGGPTRLVITFNGSTQPQDGTLDAGDEVTVSSGAITALSISGAQLIVDLSGVADAVCLTINLQGISRVSDGTILAPTTLKVRTLMGDVNKDGVVNLADLRVVRDNQNQTATIENVLADVTMDGKLDLADMVAIRNNMNRRLAACP